ncbi:putative endoplasmic reticulum membrane protein [Psilocybe cubensis]|uniref:Endoplasmic reticulum membrane protein n=1 Tax=Psilocybe cubensis TaxID=181762 RepID=A0ACB8HC05_PSICU|nr:putative endoplasmic reticulum membrane protein [Psilocybe cubensis]KAH9485530.1 putative endoplasmic reticulum membrane protein [Psilocybe cubensis]
MLASCSLAAILAACLHFTNAVDVYLSPSALYLHSDLSPEDASTALSRHLGLEAFEPLWGNSDPVYSEELFVGQGPKSALLVTVEERDAPVLSTYLHQASTNFASIFSSFQFGQSNDVASLVSFFKTSEQPAFAAVELSKLHDIGEQGGRYSEEYLDIADEIRALLQQLIDDDRFTVAVLTYTSPSVNKRAAPQETQAPLPPSDKLPPQQPIGSISTCFTTLDACNNGTSTCSGRGQCLQASKAGRTCFVCSCGITTTGEGNKIKTDHWAGESCERKDISGPFVLLTGTVIVIILLIVGSISLLYTVGDQPLPSTLLATAVPTKKE